jgi:peroxiredoxin
MSTTDERPPLPGEVAPDFTAVDADGAPRRLAELCQKGPLVLVFYRGSPKR